MRRPAVFQGVARCNTAPRRTARPPHGAVQGTRCRFLGARALLLLGLLTPGLTFAAGGARPGSSPYQASTRLRAQASLLESAGQLKRAIALYHDAWRLYPQDTVVDRIVRIAARLPVDARQVSFLLKARGVIASDAVRGRVDGYLAEALPTFKASHGAVRVLVYPPSARVVVAGRVESYRARSGDVLWFEPGTVTLRAVANGHEPAKRTTRIEAGEVRSAVVMLRPAGLSGRVTVATNPPGADVGLDGVPVGTAPTRDLQVRPGTHIVTAAMEGYLPVRRRVLVKTGRSEGLVLDLREIPSAREAPIAAVQGQAPKVRAEEARSGAADQVAARAEKDLEGGEGFEPGLPTGDGRHTGIIEPIRPGSAWRTAGWILLGTGVAVTAGGGVMHFLAARRVKEANALDPASSSYGDDFDGKSADAKRFGSLSLVGYGVGGVAIVGGVLMILLAPDGAEPTSVRLTPLPGGGLIEAGARF